MGATELVKRWLMHWGWLFMNATSVRAFVIICGIIAFSSYAVEVSIVADKDNTMWDADGLSNGKGPNLWAGANSQGRPRRSAARFDVSGNIPGEATITSAVLRLTVDGAPGGQPNFDVKIHKLTKTFGEGNSDSSNGGTTAGGGGAPAQTIDMTIFQNLYNLSNWDVAGGDFVSTASATQVVTKPRFGNPRPSIDWSSATTVEDVQEWLDGPSSNYGWMVVLQ